MDRMSLLSKYLKFIFRMFDRIHFIGYENQSICDDGLVDIYPNLISDNHIIIPYILSSDISSDILLTASIIQYSRQLHHLSFSLSSSAIKEVIIHLFDLDIIL